MDMGRMLETLNEYLQRTHEPVDLLHFNAQNQRHIALKCEHMSTNLKAAVVQWQAQVWAPANTDIGGAPRKEHEARLSGMLAEADEILGPFLRAIENKPLAKVHMQASIHANGAQTAIQKGFATTQIAAAVALLIHQLSKAKKMLHEGAIADEYLYQSIKQRVNGARASGHKKEGGNGESSRCELGTGASSKSPRRPWYSSTPRGHE